MLCDLSEIGYNAEWQCLSGKQFGTQHKRERIYCIAYSNGIGQQAFYEPSRFGIKACKNWEADSSSFSMSNEWLNRPADSFTIRRGNDVPNKLHRIKGCGNAVMPIIAYYLFQCIKLHYGTVR
ncbi:MAG: DNA cytosine methyltransferase [Betaproteobacteria bacterium]